MAEEKAAPAPQKGGGIGMVMAVVIVVVSLGGGIAISKFFLQPKLQHTALVPVGEEADNKIPESSATFGFEQASTTVCSDEPNGPSGILQYKVAVVCSNEETLKLVEKNKDWFVAMLAELHSNKTRSELMDPQIKKSIQKQALQEANSLLRRFELKQAKTEPSIIEVLHMEFNVFDL